MEFKLVPWFCFLIILFLNAKASHSMDVKCTVYETTCVIHGIDLPIDDVLNVSYTIGLEYYFTGFHSEQSTIRTFPTEIFEKLKYLRTISFKRVGMDNFSANSLENATKLEEFYLLKNPIKTVPSNAFSSNPNLVKVELWENEITDLGDYAFNSSSLKRINLDNNRIKVIKKSSFSAVTLQSVSLQYNSIENIEEGSFDLPNLRDLFLSSNQLKTLPVNFLKDAPQINMLHLQHNKLIYDAVASLENAKSLFQLEINGNPNLNGVNCFRLTQVKRLFIDNTGVDFNATDLNLATTPAVEDLSITSSRLSDSKLLYHLRDLRNLKWLYMYQNNFVTLDDFEKVKEFFPNIHTIHFQKNPWDCEWREAARKICQDLSIVCNFSYLCGPEAGVNA